MWTSCDCGEIPFCAQPDSDASDTTAPTRTRRRRVTRRKLDLAEIAHVTVNVVTIPIDACGGPSVPPLCVPVCQHANA